LVPREKRPGSATGTESRDRRRELRRWLGLPASRRDFLGRELLEPLEICHNWLADAIGVSPRRINEIVHGKRRTMADTALRLTRYGTTGRFWLNRQTRSTSKPRSTGSAAPWIASSPYALPEPMPGSHWQLAKASQCFPAEVRPSSSATILRRILA
jgi:addiction module HigA family antidote